ncbi:MAG TPA: PCI domain-containing protein [Candidatus Lokiarchaeia archaeon]|nr:PCI domain-containing protein [Candidatus Lokiarchaeia archaeon]
MKRRLVFEGHILPDDLELFFNELVSQFDSVYIGEAGDIPVLETGPRKTSKSGISSIFEIGNLGTHSIEIELNKDTILIYHESLTKRGITTNPIIETEMKKAIQRAFSTINHLQREDRDLTPSRGRNNKNEVMDDHHRNEKIARIVKVSDSLSLDDLALALDINRKDLMDNVFTWAERYGFRIAGNDIAFTGGRIDDFLNELDRQFTDWGLAEKRKDGKLGFGQKTMPNIANKKVLAENKKRALIELLTAHDKISFEEINDALDLDVSNATIEDIIFNLIKDREINGIIEDEYFLSK